MLVDCCVIVEFVGFLFICVVGLRVWVVVVIFIEMMNCLFDVVVLLFMM